jgi:hypothetical protein
MSLEQTIRKLGAKGVSQPLEKDMNDQVHAGGYTSKHFEVSAPAQKLFASLPKNVDTDKAERSVQLHDKLFAIHKKTKASERSTSADMKAAQELHDQIMSLAKEMDLEDKHGHVKDSLDFIKQKFDAEGNVKDDVSSDDIAKRYASPPKDYQSDVKNDADIDNISKFRISRDKRAQRKLKIIDDQYNPGVNEMDRIEKVSPSFLEALKKVQENALELAEKKKMTKADIAALKHPKGKIDANDLAALRAGEHKKKVAEEAKKHNNTPKGIECPVCGMEACPPVKEETLDELSDPTKAAYAMKAAGQIMKYTKDNSAYDTSAAGEKKTKDVQKRIKGLQTLQKSIEKKKVEEETLDEAQFIVIQKGMDKKRIRNNPYEIMRARKDGWAVNEDYDSGAAKDKEENDKYIGKREKHGLKSGSWKDKSKNLNKKAVTGMGEEVEELDEISGELANNYKKKSSQSLFNLARYTKQSPERDKKIVNRAAGMERAEKSIDKDIARRSAEQKKKMGEEVEQVDEITSQLVGRAANKAGKLAQWHSDNNQHIAGKAYDDQSERLWAKAEIKRKKENAAKQMANLSSGKTAKLKKKMGEDVEYIDEADMMHIKVGEKVRLTNPKAPARHTVDRIKGQDVHITKDSGEKVVLPLNRIKTVKYKAAQLNKEEVEQVDEILDRPSKELGYALKNIGSKLKAGLTGDKDTVRKRERGEEFFKKNAAKKKDEREMDSYRNKLAGKALRDMGSKTGFGSTYNKIFKEDAEQFDEGNEMQNLAKSQKSAIVKREVQQKKAMFAKKDSTDKAKFAKQLAKEDFVAKAIAILGEEFADWSFEELAEAIVAKKPRGRPRKNPLPDPATPVAKKPRGRPRKDASAAEKKPEDNDKDREHIVMGLRKAISLRGQHGVKFADGSTHQISAEHAQKALKIHDNLSRPSEKMVYQRKLAASHASFKKALEDKNPGGEEVKKTGVTLAKRAEF